MLQLLSARPSPYARKVRVVLAEKGIPFELIMEVPWDSDTQTKDMGNPLEKLPVLVVPKGEQIGDGASNGATTSNQDFAVYESHFIMEWIETKYPPPKYPSFLPEDVDLRLEAKQIEVVCDGMADAMVLLFFERQRDEDKQSGPWSARQDRKVQGGLEWLDKKAETAQNGFLVGGKYSLADIAAGSVLGWFDLRFRRETQWREKFPKLAAYNDALQQRKTFVDTQPAAQTFKAPVV